MWLIPHMFSFSHTCVVKSTYYTGSSCVVFTTQVCLIAHMCGNNQTCVENPHRQVLGYFHTCLVKHTHRLISPWANGDSLLNLEMFVAFVISQEHLGSWCPRCSRLVMIATKWISALMEYVWLLHYIYMSLVVSATSYIYYTIAHVGSCKYFVFADLCIFDLIFILDAQASLAPTQVRL